MSDKNRSRRHHRLFHQYGNRSGWRCTYCHQPVTCPRCFPLKPGSKTASMDHITPRSAGGTRIRNNLTLACEPCNNEKSSSPLGLAWRPSQWRAERKDGDE